MRRLLLPARYVRGAMGVALDLIPARLPIQFWRTELAPVNDALLCATVAVLAFAFIMAVIFLGAVLAAG